MIKKLLSYPGAKLFSIIIITFTVTGETPFLRSLAFLSRLSKAFEPTSQSNGDVI